MKETKPIWGCVRDLEPKLNEHCSKQPDNCKTCIGNDCNSMTQFQRCYFNNTDYEPSPSTLKDDNRSKICKKFDDKCFTLISKENTIVKDCLHDYAEHHHISIDFLEKYNKSLYNVCSTELCNNQIIRPMYCIECDTSTGDNCDSKPLKYVKECTLEMNSSGCFHHSDGKNTKRGCIIDLNEELRYRCESDSNECKKCSGNACNSRHYFQKCITHNLKTADKQKSKLCKRYSDKCFIHLANDIVRRGCTSDAMESPEIGIDLESDCHNRTICELCSSMNDCNNREVINEQCIECKSNDNEMCAHEPHRIKPRNCPLGLMEQGCYLMQEKSRFQRGCIAHLNAIDRYNCSHGNSTCKMCLGNTCNVKPSFQICYECTSQTDRSVCLSSPKFLNNITCSDYWSHCYTTVSKHFVARGCIGDETMPTINKCKKNPNTCKHCSDNQLCNIETVESITCITCDSLINAACATDALPFYMMTVCPIIDLQPQQCYHYINKTSSQHIRGIFC